MQSRGGGGRGGRGRGREGLEASKRDQVRRAAQVMHRLPGQDLGGGKEVKGCRIALIASECCKAGFGGGGRGEGGGSIKRDAKYANGVQGCADGAWSFASSRWLGRAIRFRVYRTDLSLLQGASVPVGGKGTS